MDFNPLGKFDPHGRLIEVAVGDAQKFYNTLPTVPQNGINRLYLHWSVAPYGCLFQDYNAMADFENNSWILKTTNSEANNVVGLNNNPEASHTWHRNSGAAGISIAGMDGATENNFGPHPITVYGLHYLCAGSAAICKKYNIDALGKVVNGNTHTANDGTTIINTTGEWCILTHGECAVIDLYPTERIDLGTLISLPIGVTLTPEMRSICGDALRTMIHAYKLALQ